MPSATEQQLISALSGLPSSFYPNDKLGLRSALVAWNGDICAPCVDQYGAVGTWDVTKVSNFRGLVDGLSNFDESLLGWDTSRVSDMGNMFVSAATFNKPLNFDTSSVIASTSMAETFC